MAGESSRRHRHASSSIGGLAALLCALAAPAWAADGRIPIVEPAAGWPYVITAPGSYYLTEDISDGTATDIIHVDADNVTIDLAGHAIRKSVPTGILVKNINDRTQIRVTNGFLVKGATAVLFNKMLGTGNYYVDHLQCLEQDLSAIAILGASGTKMTARVESNLIAGDSVGNPARGLELQFANDSHVDNNVITGCTEAIFMDRSEKNSIRYNNLSTNGKGIAVLGTSGISSNNNVSYNVVSGCNGGDGILLDGNNNTVGFNTVSKNTSVGIRIKGDNSSIFNNTTSENITGIFLEGASSSSLQYNTASGNVGAGPGGGDGIYVDAASNSNGLDWNVAATNGNCGIEIAGGATGNIVANNRTPGNAPGCVACEPVIAGCPGACAGGPPCAGACARPVAGILNGGAATIICSNLP